MIGVGFVPKSLSGFDIVLLHHFNSFSLFFVHVNFNSFSKKPRNVCLLVDHRNQVGCVLYKIAILMEKNVGRQLGK
jgi:hypothetical protein